MRYSGDAYSFQCGMQLLMLGENVMVKLMGIKSWKGRICYLKRISVGYSGDAYPFPTGKSADS